MDTTSIRAIQRELIGSLNQLPKEASGDSFFNDQVWENFNKAINELNLITGKDYSRFKVEAVIWNRESRQYLHRVGLLNLRGQMGALIERIGAEYFPNEASPLSPQPNTLITQSLTNSTAIEIQVVVRAVTEISNFLSEKEKVLEEGSEERNFINVIKRSLGNISSIAELIALIFSTAETLRMPVEKIAQLFTR